jgi:hypothetical protein
LFERIGLTIATQTSVRGESGSGRNGDNKGKKLRFYSERKKMQRKIPAFPVKKQNRAVDIGLSYLLNSDYAP